ARVLDADLVRLQCYEGVDASQALYEWDYSRQLLHARTAGEHDLYGLEFLVERPLLRAIRAGSAAVLLVDELDRADDEFEAFLLEVLSDFSVTIPELGTIAAEEPPAVMVTSNRTRELHDALKRRCLYHWIDHPSLEREVEIIRVRAPEVPEALARQVAAAVQRIRGLDVAKRPGVAEAIDWANALALLGFGRYLRTLGLNVGTGRILNFCRAAALLDATDPKDLRMAAHATLVSRREDFDVLDGAFDRYFRGTALAVEPAESREPHGPG